MRRVSENDPAYRLKKRFLPFSGPVRFQQVFNRFREVIDRVGGCFRQGGGGWRARGVGRRGKRWDFISAFLDFSGARALKIERKGHAGKRKRRIFAGCAGGLTRLFGKTNIRAF